MNTHHHAPQPAPAPATAPASATARLIASLAATLLALCLTGVWPATTVAADDSPQTGSVVFIHPDGASAATWAAARNLLVGPDGDLHWDRLPHIAVYRGHMANNLTATSNGGATTHAYGVKVAADAFGTYGTDMGDRSLQQPKDADGQSLSVVHQALAANLPVGLVQSGVATEPGTAAFVASVPKRSQHDDIAQQLVESNVAVLLSGGERYFLPQGTDGVHGPGVRSDDLNLIERAQQLGYTVVYTREQLANLPDDTPKVLGLFATASTFNDRPEEILAALDLPLYDPDAPTLAEMTAAALRFLAAANDRFLLVVEEEGTDNFGNNNNAAGVLEACRRADETYGLLRQHLQTHPNTLILTAADSDGGGLRLIGERHDNGQPNRTSLPHHDNNGSPIDGLDGPGSTPFMAAPDRNGLSMPFRIQWAAQDDVTGGILVRAEGLNAHRVQGSMDNTEIAPLIRRTLFGPTPEAPDAPDAPDAP